MHTNIHLKSQLISLKTGSHTRHHQPTIPLGCAFMPVLLYIPCLTCSQQYTTTLEVQEATWLLVMKALCLEGLGVRISTQVWPQILVLHPWAPEPHDPMAPWPHGPNIPPCWKPQFAPGSVQLWDIINLDTVQSRARKTLKGRESLLFEDRLKTKQTGKSRKRKGDQRCDGELWGGGGKGGDKTGVPAKGTFTEAWKLQF